MTEATVVSTTMVKGRNSKEPRQSIELTPSDLMYLLAGPIQKGFLYLKPETETQNHDTTTFIEHLKNSLSSTLDPFFPLAGGLAMVEHNHHDKKTISFSIDCNNEGAQFVHAVADHVTVADILRPVFLPSILHSFFALNGIKSYEGVSKPLLGIQVTELVDGVFIGCSMNHSVADGSSYWNFLNSWSEISRGGLDHHNFMPPVFDRSFFGSNYCFPIKIPFSLDEIDSRANKLTPPSPLERKVFHFSKTKIGELKARTNAEAADGSSTNRNPISSLQSVLAHVWRSVIRNRGVNPTEETSLLFAVDIRSRISPPLPEQYLGNAIDVGLVTLTVNDMIREDGLGYAALQINKAVVSHTGEKVRRNLESWIQNPKLLGSDGVPSNALVVAGSPRFDVYGNDFGWGKPIAVRSRPLNQFEGLMDVFPGMEEGSMDIEICSSAEFLVVMGNDSEMN